MDETTAIMIQMGEALLSLVAKQTVGAVSAKIKTLKSEKDLEKVRLAYDEIVNDLMADQQEAIRIAQTYKAEVDRVVISDQDIEHLNRTVTQVLAILKEMSPEVPIDMFEKLQVLVSVDTLKTMQLLGFNYKVAIGEPLTELCSAAIRKLGGAQSSKGPGTQTSTQSQPRTTSSRHR